MVLVEVRLVSKFCVFLKPCISLCWSNSMARQMYLSEKLRGAQVRDLAGKKSK